GRIPPQTPRAVSLSGRKEQTCNEAAHSAQLRRKLRSGVPLLRKAPRWTDYDDDEAAGLGACRRARAHECRGRGADRKRRTAEPLQTGTQLLSVPRRRLPGGRGQDL